MDESDEELLRALKAYLSRPDLGPADDLWRTCAEYVGLIGQNAVEDNDRAQALERHLRERLLGLQRM